MQHEITSVIDELIAAAFYPVWILGATAVVAVGIYGTIRCFQLNKKVPGFGFIALIAGWFAAQPLYPFAMFVAAYTESERTNASIYVVFLGYLCIAAIISFGILRYLRKIS